MLSLDIVGVGLSSARLAALTYGFICAGQQSWTDGLTWGAISCGAVLLVAFVLWQLRCRTPLIDLDLFLVPAFRWGTVFLTMMGLAMFGVLFALPLYFQSVQGNSTLGTGLRLLPMIGGLLVGTRIVDRFSARLGSGVTISIGFGVAAASLAAAAFTTAATPFAVIAGWLGRVGVGMGLVMPTALNAALDALEPSRAGSGSALIQALRQAGGTVAALGTVLNAGYRSETPRVPEPTLQADIDKSLSTGMAAARALDRPALVAAVQAAFVHGMSLMLIITAALAAGLAALAAVVMRRRRPAARHRARHGPPSLVDARQSIHAVG